MELYVCVRARERESAYHIYACCIECVFPLQISVRIECSIKLATHSDNDIYRYVIHSRESKRGAREWERKFKRWRGSFSWEFWVCFFTSNYHKSFIWIVATNLNRFSISKMKENRTSCFQFRFILVLSHSLTLSYPRCSHSHPFITIQTFKWKFSLTPRALDDRPVTGITIPKY